MLMRDWVTPYQAAQALGVSLNDVMRLIAERRIKTTNLGSTTIRYIHRDELKRYIAEQKAK